MIILILIKSMLTGAAIAAPIGPMGLLCMRSSLLGGWKKGMAAGLGIATADACYAAIAAFGVSAISSTMMMYSYVIKIGGGLLIILLGLSGFRRKPALQDPNPPEPSRKLLTFASSFLLTLTNPMTLISFAALAAGLGTPSITSSWEGAAAFSAGIWLGSALWWSVLTTTVNLFRKRLLAPAAIRTVDLASALILTGMGVWSVLSALFNT
ncbi:threonine/homoserine/homoserine lactone efflux protein [Fontibacillus phaseoli]|uniref:Threonine/homoserine/homoserine lactone efflux protein n=1 Tax=Fontibacillus phaseoli TaxID=1416533 RepID=A0A369BPL3_9BACL|nr:LysE family transporter [Fontibacillus phaseoli]RCX23562.1 threonine/homoserine/homoserine lactone efflux protein [Fontibacillus phaseoli]